MPEADDTGSTLEYRPSIADWYRLAFRRSVILRGLKFAVVVGAILIAINHGDTILAGELTATNYFKMALTVVVPYVVSVLSSVGATVESARRARKG